MNKRKSQTIRLSVMLSLTFGFFVVELVVGYVTGSLALISDSYHMLSDTIALVIGLVCVRISYWNSPNNTYGWVRAEVLGALINAVFLIALCFTIVTDGITRLIEPEPIKEVDLLLYVGIAGLAINVFGLIMFCSDTQGGHHGHSHGGGGGGGGGGEHGHSHGGDSGHSHGAGGHHSHAVGNGHSSEESDKDKVDGSFAAKAIDWQPTSPSSSSLSSPPPSYPAAAAAEVNGGVNPSIHQITLTIDGDCEVDNQTTIEVCRHEEVDDDDDDGEDAMSYVQKATSVKSGSQMNMLGVFLHVFGDALGSVVVIVSALVIKFVNEPWADRLDPAMSIIMAIIILSTTIPLFKESARVLMQTVPTHIKVSDLQEKLLNKVNGITGLHEFHVWQLTGNRIVASGHIRVDNLSDYAKVAVKVKSFFHEEGIHSTTFQPEFAENVSGDSVALLKRDCSLECGPDKMCFENTCCSNKLKLKNKKNGSGSNSSRTASIDVEPPSASPQQQTNQSFEMVDETNTSRTTDNGLASTEGRRREEAGVEMEEYITKI